MLVIITLIMTITIMYVALKIKCDQYWPADSEPLFYGDLQLQVIDENISSDWHIREMHISLVCVSITMQVRSHGVHVRDTKL